MGPRQALQAHTPIPDLGTSTAADGGRLHTVQRLAQARLPVGPADTTHNLLQATDLHGHTTFHIPGCTQLDPRQLQTPPQQRPLMTTPISCTECATALTTVTMISIIDLYRQAHEIQQLLQTTADATDDGHTPWAAAALLLGELGRLDHQLHRLTTDPAVAGPRMRQITGPQQAAAADYRTALHTIQRQWAHQHPQRRRDETLLAATPPQPDPNLPLSDTAQDVIWHHWSTQVGVVGRTQATQQLHTNIDSGNPLPGPDDNSWTPDRTQLDTIHSHTNQLTATWTALLDQPPPDHCNPRTHTVIGTIGHHDITSRMLAAMWPSTLHTTPHGTVMLFGLPTDITHHLLRRPTRRAPGHLVKVADHQTTPEQSLMDVAAQIAADQLTNNRSPHTPTAVSRHLTKAWTAASAALHTPTTAATP